MTRAIRIHQTGGPEVLKWDEIEVGDPGPGEVRLRQSACGLNYIDVYGRSGMYPVGDLPAVLGMEAVGSIDAIGADVDGFASGDRVAYPMTLGAYAKERLIDADKLVKIPDTISDESAAAMMLKGLTAHYLLFRTYPVQAGDSILVYAAAGGVGLILCQWASQLGVNVIGCVGSDIASRVRDITDGTGVAAAYDSIGKATFTASLDSLRPFGVMATYGNASGPVEPFSPLILAGKGSLYVTRPTLATHIATPELLQEGANRLITAVESGQVRIHVKQSFALADCAEAHRQLEARTTTGSTVLKT
jgi:NADPH2:quinone reductase